MFMINFAPIVGIFFLIIFLVCNARLEKKVKNIFFWLISLEIIELIAYNLELYYASLSSLSSFRILFSAIGYSIRPILIYLILLLVLREDSKSFILKKILILPLFINFIFSFSAFFTDLVYSYTLDNQFVRGPLGNFTLFTIIFYLITFIYSTAKNYNKKHNLERFIIYSISILIILSMIIELVWSIRSIGRTSIFLSTIFFYMFYQVKQYQEIFDLQQQKEISLKEKANKDSLTGLLNKETFLNYLKENLSNIDNLSTLTLLFVDIDNFKNINDTHGHITGDEVLLFVSKNLKEIFLNDIVGRYGGDEFFILIKNATEKQIRKKLSKLNLEKYKFVKKQKMIINVSLSIGAAILNKKEKITEKEFIFFADQLLYKAKKNGKSQYFIDYI